MSVAVQNATNRTQRVSAPVLPGARPSRMALQQGRLLLIGIASRPGVSAKQNRLSLPCAYRILLYARQLLTSFLSFRILPSRPQIDILLHSPISLCPCRRLPARVRFRSSTCTCNLSINHACLPVKHCSLAPVVHNIPISLSPVFRHRHSHLPLTATVLLANDLIASPTTNNNTHPGAFQRTTLVAGPVSPKQPPRSSSCITNNSISSSKPCHIALQTPHTQNQAHLPLPPCTPPTPYRNNVQTTHAALQNPPLQPFCRTISRARLLLDRHPAIATALHTPGHTCGLDLAAHRLQRRP